MAMGTTVHLSLSHVGLVSGWACFCFVGGLASAFDVVHAALERSVALACKKDMVAHIENSSDAVAAGWVEVETAKIELLKDREY